MKLQELKKEYEKQSKIELNELKKAFEELKEHVNNVDYINNFINPAEIERLAQNVTAKNLILLETISKLTLLNKIDQQQ